MTMPEGYDHWRTQSGEPEDDGFEEWSEGLYAAERGEFMEDFISKQTSVYGTVLRLDGKDGQQYAKVGVDLYSLFYEWLHEYYVKSVLPYIDDYYCDEGYISDGPDW